MKKPRILLADNDAKILEDWGHVLRKGGYEVIEAGSVEAAEAALDKEKLDLAVLDLRLRNDDDDLDRSGLELAYNVSGRFPVIILSWQRSFEYVRNVLRQRKPSPVAVDYIYKGEAPGELLKAVREAIIPQVFIVHGHDEDAKNAVVIFLEREGFRSIILREQPSEGRTIIEKFEKYSNVSFAVVLLTSDDVGGRRGSRASKLQARARQNVIFELGFFVGTLGRERVAVLSRQEKDKIEIPSDYEGVQFILMDSSERWQRELAREMKTALGNFATNWPC